MRRWNGLSLGAVLLLLALVSVLSACRSAEERVAEHLQRAAAFDRDAQYAEAISEYRSALELAPDQGRVHFELARTYQRSGSHQDFFAELSEAARLAPQDAEVKLDYARELSRSADADTLERAVGLAHEVATLEPDNGEAWLVEGSALAGLGRLTEARQRLEKATEVAPAEGEPLRQLADVLRRLGEQDGAEQRLREATRIDPGFLSHSSLGLLLAAQGERDAEAEAAYRAGIEHATEAQRAQARGAVLGFLIARDRLDDAEAELESALATEGPDDLSLAMFRARLEAHRGEAKKAVAVLIDAADARPDDPEPYLLLSIHRSRRGDREGAIAAADRALAADPSHARSRLQKAYLLIDAGDRSDDDARVAEGRTLLDAVMEGDADLVAEGLLVKGRLDLAEDRFDDAIRSLHRAIDLRADGGRAHFLLGEALFREEDLRGAQAELARAFEIEPDRGETLALLTRTHSALGESALALELGSRALRVTPNDTALRIAMAQSLVDEGRESDAREILDEIPEEARDAPSYVAAGRVYELLGDAETARQAYRAAAERDPYDPAALSAMLTMEVRRKRLGESVELIRTAARERPGDVGLAQLESHVARLTGDLEAATMSLRRAIRIEPENTDLYNELARLLHGAGRPGEALLIYESALRLDPDNGRMHLAVGSLHEQAGRREEAIASYEAALQADDSLSAAKNNLAFLLAEIGRDLERALVLAREANEGLPDQPHVADTLGYVLLKTGNPSEAIGYLRKTERALTPQSPLMGIVRHHLAMAYEANGNRGQAIQALKRALRDLAKTPKSPESAEPQWASEARGMLDRLQGG